MRGAPFRGLKKPESTSYKYVRVSLFQHENSTSKSHQPQRQQYNKISSSELAAYQHPTSHTNLPTMKVATILTLLIAAVVAAPVAEPMPEPAAVADLETREPQSCFFINGKWCCNLTGCSG